MGHTTAWYEDQPFAIGDRVQLIDGDECQAHGSTAGRVIGYDASGPRRGEAFIRVLVLMDGTDSTVAALPPHCLTLQYTSERFAVAATMMAELERTLTPEQFASLCTWLTSDTCARLLTDPLIGRKNVQLGNLAIPGFLLHELRRLASERNITS